MRIFPSAAETLHEATQFDSPQEHAAVSQTPSTSVGRDPRSTPLTATGETRAVRPEDVVRQILEAADFPMFSHQMCEIMASLDGGEASAQRLANLVLRDYALTVKVIRTANTVHYNRTGRPVQSATHAMMLLGASTVRDLASGLLLFEHYSNRSPGLKELMLLSLLTSGHAREVALRAGDVDPETAQLCGMFRNLGEVLVAAHLPREYAAVLRSTAERREQGEVHPRMHAAASVLGCSFEDVGVAIAGDWGMPDAVFRGMRATGGPREQGLELMTAFGHELTNAIYREEPAAARTAVGAVMKGYGPRLQLTRDVLAAVADSAVAGTRETFASARVALDDLRLARQISTALFEERADQAPAATTAKAAAPNGAPAAPGAAAATQQAPAGTAAASPEGPAGATDDAPPVSGPPLAALRDRLAQEVENASADVTVYDLQRTVLIALEAMMRGGPVDRAAFCVPDARLTALSARYALGEGAEKLLAGPLLPLAPAPGAPGPVLLRGQEVVISAGEGLVPADAQLLRGWNAASVALIPVAIDGVTIGCVFADRCLGSQVIDTAGLAYVRRVAAALARAIVLRRGAAAPSPQAPAHTPEDKAAVVLRLLRGEPVAQVSADSGVSVAELDRWRAEFLDGAVARLGKA